MLMDPPWIATSPAPLPLPVELPSPSPEPHDPCEHRMTSLGRPPWNHLGVLQVAGSRSKIGVTAGLYWDQGRGLGTYYSADGQSYLCNEACARNMAREEKAEFRREWAGEHTGGVWNVNYRYAPNGKMG